MKVLIMGAAGTIGQAVVDRLGDRHDIVRAGRHGPDMTVDMTSPESIDSMFKRLAQVEAVVVAAGGAAFKSLSELTPADNETAIESKLKGQVDTVLVGQHYLADGGNFTLTSGVMVDDPIACGASAAMANGGVEAFVRSASCELQRGLRLNVVNPSVLDESWSKYGAFFPGFESVSGERVGMAYQKSIEGCQTGQIFYVR
ncbi:short chain dehydrogenase [Salinisphaera sp.]|uniref:short chain dehydrogenase n=1 Tax=Salinisphaera sp. TaxID=1914330 RepID=UPI000C3E583C|nr:short chain dehydrogenase [Salinisphaera sp.]MBS61533.1 short chain dehydrogenase [Salinisphaera sp.]